ncbi:hypothetical protein L6R50_24480 [Myxococcota bacterium]|nr:hypothetical protein [Myxococcota bacterium]
MKPLRALAASAALAALCASCGPPPAPDEPPDDRTETGEDIDTGDVTSIEVRPGDVSIDLYTELDLKASAILLDGSFYDLRGVTWTSDAPDVAVINSTTGHLVPVSEGEARIVAEFEGLRSLPTPVTVVAPGAVEVTVVDSATGQGVPFAFVAVGDDPVLAQGMADHQGRILLEGPITGPVTITCAADGYDRTTAVGVAPRTAKIPVVLQQDLDDAYVEGKVRFSEDDQAPGTISMALVMPTTPVNPIFLWALELIGPARHLSGWGLEWDLPENLYVDGLTTEFKSTTRPGEAVYFAAGGAWDLGVMLEMGNAINESGVGPVIETMTRHIEDMRFGLSAPFHLPPDGEVIAPEFAVDVQLTVKVDVDTPAPPEGAWFPDPVTVMAWRTVGPQGYAAIGFGSNDHPYIDTDPPGDDDDSTFEAQGGAGASAVTLAAPIQAEERVNVPVSEIPREGVLDDVFEGVGSRYLAFVNEGGTSSDKYRGSLVVSPPVFDSDVRLPSFLTLTAPIVPDTHERTLHWASDPEVDLERFVLTVDESRRWWVFAPGGLGEATLPDGLFDPFTEQTTVVEDMDGVRWTGESMSLEIADYQSLLNEADEGIEDLEELVNRRATYELVPFPWTAP